MEANKEYRCRSCGKLLQEEFNVCPYCGERLRKICVQCSRELEEEYKACPYCGKKVKEAPDHSQVSSFFTKITEKAPEFFAAAGAFFVSLGHAIGKAAVIVFEWLKKTFTKIWEGIKAYNWGKIGDFFKVVGTAVGKAAKKTFEWIRQTARKIWDAAHKIFRQLQEKLAGMLEKKWSPDQSKKMAAVVLAAGLVLCIGLIIGLIAVISGPSGESSVSQAVEETETEYITVQESFPAVDPATQKWLVMIYADADDEVLENDMYFDINEAETAGSTERVQIVAQVDRYMGGYSGDGDWTGARRYFITQDDDLNVVNSELVEDLGEVDMGSADTLVDFATWAINTYPADRYVLIMSDHGAGWPGGWTDGDPVNPDGNYIYLQQLDTALAEILDQTGIHEFELVGMDACLMSMLEVYSSLEPYAHYAVGSEEYEPGMGWAYSYFLNRLIEQPEMDGAELSRAIVDGFIHEDLRILDDSAYKELLADYDLPLDVDEELMAGKLAERITLSAIDLSVIPTLNDSFNKLLLDLKEVDQALIAQARSYAQPFMNIFYDDLPSPYIDLQNFLNFVSENIGDQNTREHLTEVQSAFDNAVIAEVHGAKLPGASGISIYFPVSQHYWEDTIYSYEGYPVIADRFSKNSLWDDFLAFHYAGQDFDQGIPSIEAKAVAPGYSEITISQPVISPGVVSSGDPTVNIQADVSGDRIAYMYVVTMFRYEDRLLFYQNDYILGDDSREVSGVVYPSYERRDGVKHIDIDYTIYSTGVTDGTTAAFAVLEPETYGTTADETIYSVKGFYIYSDSGKRVSATMYFYNDGENRMRNIVGYFGDKEHGISPAEITPRKGDQFQFVDTWWLVDADGNVTDQLTDGNTLVFGDSPFQQGVATQFVYPGQYFIAIGVEDMDGNLTYSFAPVIVE